MRLEIGQKVAVLDDVLKGVIVNITDKFIDIQDSEGMIYQLKPEEIVVIENDQHELSKYSDINNSMLKEKASDNKKGKSAFVKQKNEVVLEVDLHIHQLVNSIKGMDNYDMLNLQIETAKRKLEYAIRNRILKLVFIHGVGEGVLKSELQFLFKKYPVDFYDASYQKYGLGATEVYIYQNHKS